MAALLGISDDDAEAACQRAEGDVWVANYNAPGQVVIAGTAEAVAVAGRLAKELGAKRVMPIPVSGAFHTPLMQAARAEPPQGAGRRDVPGTRGAAWWPTSTPASTTIPPTGPASCRPSSAARSAGARRSRRSPGWASPH